MIGSYKGKGRKEAVGSILHMASSRRQTVASANNVGAVFD
jgi:hypothetical protein